MPSEYDLIKAVLQQIGKEEPRPIETEPPGPGMIYSPEEMERQRFEEYTGHDPKLSMMKNLYKAWRGNRILGAPIPGANPEVGTPGDALTGALMSAAPMAKIAGKTAGGGSVQKPAPAGRRIDTKGPAPTRVERAERDASRLLQNALKQVQDNVRKNPEGAFPTASSKAEFLQARVDPGKPTVKGFLAEVHNTPSYSEWAKRGRGETPMPMGKILDKVGGIKVDTKEIAKKSRSPQEFVKELIGTLAHESGLHTRVGSHKYDEWAKPGLKRGGPSMADVPLNAVAAYGPEFSGQVQMDVVRQRMMQTPLVEALMKTAGVKDSPINNIYYNLKVGK